MLKHKIRRSTLAVTGGASRLMKLLLRDEAISGKFLLLAAVVALALANSPWKDAYFNFWQQHFYVGIGGWGISETFKHWIDEGLMAIFFLVIGLEVKREIIRGELHTMRAASLPLAAAIGGMVFAIAIYVLFNHDQPGFHGWGMPMTTDTALALGVLALLGKRIPAALKVLLLAIMVVDDIGAIITIAIFYNNDVRMVPLLIGAGVLGLMLLLQWIKVLRFDTFIFLGILMWLAVHASGVHATIAGAVMGLAAPIVPRTRKLTRRAIAERLEKSLIPVTTFVIIPLFALANAGVELRPEAFAAPGTSLIALGVIAGLVIGKPLGIIVGAWLVVRLKVSELPRGVVWQHITGIALLAGIGFTLSIFIAELAFESSKFVDAAKISILGAAIVSTVAGLLCLWHIPRKYDPKPEAGEGPLEISQS